MGMRTVDGLSVETARMPAVFEEFKGSGIVKRRHKTPYILLILLALLVLLLIGCADKDEEVSTEEQATTAVVVATEEPEVEPQADASIVEPTAESEPEPEPTEEPEPTPEPVTFDNLHVPSPDWSEQIIYFMMTDRFADGDPSNNDFGAGEYAAYHRVSKRYPICGQQCKAFAGLDPLTKRFGWVSSSTPDLRAISLQFPETGSKYGRF